MHAAPQARARPMPPPYPVVEGGLPERVVFRQAIGEVSVRAALAQGGLVVGAPAGSSGHAYLAAPRLERAALERAGDERRVRRTRAAREDVHHRADCVRAPERRLGSADDLDPLDPGSGNTTEIEAAAIQVHTDPVDQHQVVVGLPAAGEE